MKSPHEEKAAIDELRRGDSPEGYTKTLDLMFEAWLCSNYVDGTTIEQRSLTLANTKSLKRFLRAI